MYQLPLVPDRVQMYGRVPGATLCKSRPRMACLVAPCNPYLALGSGRQDPSPVAVLSRNVQAWQATNGREEEELGKMQITG